MSLGSDLLTLGWNVLKEHHGTDITYNVAIGDEQPYTTKALVSLPSEPTQFGRRNLGYSYVLFVDADAAPWAVDGAVTIGATTYRVLQVERQPSAVSVRLLIGMSPFAGRQPQ